MKLKERFGRLHPTLKEMLAGIVLIAVPAAVIGGLIAPSHLRFAVSLLLGAAGAALMALHMYSTISRELDMAEPDDAAKYARRSWLLRLIFMILLILCSLKLSFLSFPGMFAGLLTLKLSVYIRPLIIKIKGRMTGN